MFSSGLLHGLSMTSFFEDGVYDFYHLIELNSELFLYDQIATIFGMIPNNRFFVKYVQLLLVLSMI